MGLSCKTRNIYLNGNLPDCTTTNSSSTSLTRYLPLYYWRQFSVLSSSSSLDINVFFSPFETFSSSVHESLLVLSAPWHRSSPSVSHTQVWAPAEVRGTCFGGWKRHVRSARHSEHVEPSRSMQPPTYVIHYSQVKKCPTSHVISRIVNVINVVRHYIHGDGKVFPRHQHASIYIVPN